MLICETIQRPQYDLLTFALPSHKRSKGKYMYTLRILYTIQSRPQTLNAREERGRVWNITPGGSVPKAEIPRQVLIGHNTGCEAAILRKCNVVDPPVREMAKYSREQIDAAIDAAMQVFCLKSLKYQQREAIREFVSGRDVFVSLPTGFGKSYCYALLPTVFDNLRPHEEPSIMLCVSPLTALMMEQRDKLCTRGQKVI